MRSKTNNSVDPMMKAKEAVTKKRITPADCMMAGCRAFRNPIGCRCRIKARIRRAPAPRSVNTSTPNSGVKASLLMNVTPVTVAD